MKFALIALTGLVAAKHTLKHHLHHVAALELDATPACEPALDVTQQELDIQLDYFSRNFNMDHYKNAMSIYAQLKKDGKDPKLSVHTWELYDHAFSFERVRRYELVQDHMEKLQHFEDNLNMNFSNSLHVKQFVQAAKDCQTALNAKYHDGEFHDPAQFDPEDDHPVTWSTVKFNN